MSACECPTCGQQVQFTKLYVSKCGTLAAYGDESVRLYAMEGAILRIIARGGTIESVQIRERLPRTGGRVMKTKTLGVHFYSLRQKIEPLGLRIICVERSYRLIYPAPMLQLVHMHA